MQPGELTSYIGKLELLAFFSGYPVLYMLLYSIPLPPQKGRSLITSLRRMIPYSYALCGTLFVGLQLKNLYPPYSWNQLLLQLEATHYIKAWALLSLLFWVPYCNKWTGLSFVHSLLFFAILLKDILAPSNSSAGTEGLGNDMKIYTISIVLNTMALLLLALVLHLLQRLQKRRARISLK